VSIDAVATVVLAHQGGWDETLLVAVPIGLFAWVLHVANKRADRLHAKGPEQPDSRPTDSVPPTT
jgi:hypothetical protein